MTSQLTWRGPFHNEELNQLHAEAFRTRVFTPEEWNWEKLVAAQSLGWVVARQGPDGLGRTVVAEAAEGARRAGCEWLHVDFE